MTYNARFKDLQNSPETDQRVAGLETDHRQPVPRRRRRQSSGAATPTWRRLIWGFVMGDSPRNGDFSWITLGFYQVLNGALIVFNWRSPNSILVAGWFIGKNPI